MEVINIEPGISLINLAPNITGFEEFLSTYVIQSGKTALIDVGPASTLENLFAGLSELKIKPEEIDYILCTHIHLDHSGGCGGALKRLPRATCVVHEKGIYHLSNPAKLWKSSLETLGHFALDYGEPEGGDETRLVSAGENMVIDLEGIKLEVIQTPGHASHHLSFWDRQNSRLFVGEAAGIYIPNVNGSRPATPTPFDLEQALNSLDKLISMEPSRMFYSHFGVAKGGTERLVQFKDQLLLWADIVDSRIDNQFEWQKIFQKLIDTDKCLSYLDKLDKNRRQLEINFIKNAVIGLRRTKKI